jgi:hypothetical protein
VEEGQSTLKVNSREILFPPAQLTMGEMCDAEDLFGVDWMHPERSGMRITIALLFIAIRRVDATVTPGDVRDLDPTILEQLTGGDASPPVETDMRPLSDDASTAASDGSDNGQQATGSPGSASTSPSDPVTSPT